MSGFHHILKFMLKESFLLPALVCASVTIAQAQPVRAMPDGSIDAHIGIAAVSAPQWDGARQHAVGITPVIQSEWSSGIFVAGKTVGWHFSSTPTVEFGPQLALHESREYRPGAKRSYLASPDVIVGLTAAASVISGDPSRSRGMIDIGYRPELGAFHVLYLTPQVRLSNQLMYGAGLGRNGLRHVLNVQHVSAPLSGRHRVSISVGVTFANRRYIDSYFGVSASESRNSAIPEYSPSGGVKDLHAQMRWNWMMSPSWLLGSSIRISHLRDGAAHSPLVERSNQVSISTGLAYRL